MKELSKKKEIVGKSEVDEFKATKESKQSPGDSTLKLNTTL